LRSRRTLGERDAELSAIPSSHTRVRAVRAVPHRHPVVARIGFVPEITRLPSTDRNLAGGATTSILAGVLLREQVTQVLQ